MGSTEYAPEAILGLARRVIAVVPSAQLSGVVGDASHRYGYHRCRNVLPVGDYSVQLAEDRGGDGWAASALDVSFDPPGMRLVTGRLLASAKDQDDPRLNYCREFYGTTDGKVVAGWDTYYGTPATSDDTHLWHVHISFLRQYANDPAAMDAVYSVIVGETVAQWRARTDSKPEGGTDMDLDKDKLAGTKDYPGRTAREAFTDMWQRTQWDLPALREEVTALRADVAELKAKASTGPSAADVAAEIIRQLRS